MTSVVTGGCGFIGRHLVAQLAERGEAVRVFDLGPFDGLPPGVETIEGSVTDAVAVRHAMRGARIVYHLAAHAHLWAPRRDLFHEINVDGTRTVLAEAGGAGVERVVHTSSLVVLIGRGGEAASQPVDESRQTTLDDMLGDYCRSKFLAEQSALAAADAGLPVVVVLPTMPVGPGDLHLTPPSRMILDLVNGRTPAYLDCLLNLIDVRDLAAGHIAAAERGRCGERYILGHRNLSMHDLLGGLHELTGVRMPKRRVPYRLAYAAALLSEARADWITRRSPGAPLTGVRLARHMAPLDSGKAVRELGLPQSPIERALRDQLLWMQAQGRIKRDLPGLHHNEED